MNILKLPKTILNHKYVVLEGEYDLFRLILPNGESFLVEQEELTNYLMRHFNDEVFVDRLLAGIVNFRRVQLFPKQKHFVHIPERSYEPTYRHNFD